MLDKYIIINQETFKASGKQNKDGIWLCEKIEVVAKDKKELEIRYRDGIGVMNKINNQYNKKEKSTPTTPKKENKPIVKGLE